jgi:putrescine---pyruvate transaminase
MAKGLSSGYLPIGAVGLSDRIALPFIDKAGEFYHGYTYAGHPACAAAALENIKIIEEDNLVEAVSSGIGAYLRKRWATLADHDMVGEVRMTGMIGALELVPNKKSRKRFADEGKVGTLCRNHSVKSGLVMRACWDRMVVAPPFVINEAEVDELVTKARTALDLTWKQVKAEGLV